MGNDLVRNNPVAAYEPNRYAIGQMTDAKEKAYLSDADLDHHMAVLGGTGSGKSKFLERLMRCFLHGGRGFAFIDPHGDTSEDLLAYAAHHARVEKNDSFFKRLHYLEPTYEMVFGYDPFKFQPLHEIPDSLKSSAYQSWLHTKVDAVSAVLQRKQGQYGFEGMPTLQRVLRDVLYATGRAVDEFGRHLPLADALVLLDVAHPRHEAVFNRVAHLLDSDIRSDFNLLHRMKSVRDLRQETGSTVNRLRSFLGPVVKGIFAETLNTINFYDIMQRGEILLVNLRETDYFSADQASAIGGLFIHEILSTAARTPRERRREFSLIIDEAGEFIGEDLMRALRAVRKYKLSIILAGQNLDTFKKGETDLSPTVLSQCGSVVCFQQTYKKDLEILADRLGRGNLDFQKLYQVMDRPDGYDVMDIESYTDSFTWQDGWTAGGSEKSEESITRTRNAQRTIQNTWSYMEGLQDNRTENWSHADGDNHAQSRKMFPMHPQNPITHVDSRSQQESFGAAYGHGTSKQDTSGGGVAEAMGSSESEGFSSGHSKNYGISGSKGGSRGLTRGKQYLARTREEVYETGQLLNSVADQFERMMRDIFSLDQAEAVVKLKSSKQAIVVKVADVNEVWHPENKFRQIEKLKKELVAIRPYLVAPSMGNEAESERLDGYVGTGEQTEEAKAEPPKKPKAKDRGRGIMDKPNDAEDPFETKKPKKNP